MSGETVYCDNYDEIVGNTVEATVQAKVVDAPEADKPETSDADVTTKAESK